MNMLSPSSFAVFAIVNAVTWPGFALVYWFYYQRKEEELLDAAMDQSTNEMDSGGAKSDSKVGDDSR